MVVTLKFTPPWIVRCLAAAEAFLTSERSKLASLGARVLGTTIAGLALSATTTADVPADRIQRFPDPRIARLDKFFKTYHCPTPYPTPDYLRAADTYKLDYRLLPAVSIRETLCGRAEREQHNAWGYHPGHQTFPSIEAGIDFVARRLAEHPYYRGKTLKDKLFVYNPRPAYPDEVSRIMQQIE